MALQLTQIQMRFGIGSLWTSSNPTLLAGEIGYDSTAYAIKVGNGSSNWTTLGYYNGLNQLLTVQGDMVYASTASTPARLAVGTVGQVLQSNGTTPAWVDKTQNVYENIIIDSSCQVVQGSAAPNISTTYQYGTVDIYKVKAGGTVGAGTINQGTTIGKNLTSVKAVATTLTGSGAIYAECFIEAKDAKKYKNLTASFSCQVTHDVGSNVNYYIYINKANSADNFSAVTNISTSSAIVVATATETTIKLEAVAMGDCSNGISIEVKSDCGAVTTKNFEFTDYKLEKGSYATPFIPQEFSIALRQVMRMREKSTSYGTTPAVNLGTNSAGVQWFVIPSGIANREYAITFSVSKRTAPAITLFPSGASGGTTGQIYSEDIGGGNSGNRSAGTSRISNGSFVAYTSTLATTNHLTAFHYDADCRF
jgi:hypothetical protein